MDFYAGYPRKLDPAELKSAVEHRRSFYSHSNIGNQLHVDLKSLALLADNLEQNAQTLKECDALWIESPDEEDCDEFIEDDKAFAKKCEGLSRVLEFLATHGRLQRFDWTWLSGCMDCGQPEVPLQVWVSLAKNGRSLRSLNITPTGQDGGGCYEESWEVFPSDNYVALRTLTLMLQRAHGWDGAKLLSMLKGLIGLTSLHIFLPTCCGLRKFGLPLHLPNLRSFSLFSTGLPNAVTHGEPLTQDFFKRHRLLEYLHLTYVPDAAADGSDDGFQFDVKDELADGSDAIFQFDDEDLPNIRAISIDWLTDQDIPSLGAILAKRPLEAVQMDTLPNPDSVPDLHKNTLKCLHINSSSGIVYVRRDVRLYVRLLEALPMLVELRIDAPTGDAYPKPALEPLSGKDLFRFLKALSSTPGCANALTALDFIDPKGQFLSAEELADIPCGLPSLKYIGWEVQEKKVLYKLQRKDGKVSAVEIEPLRPQSARPIWVDDTILDHFGSRAHRW